MIANIIIRFGTEYTVLDIISALLSAGWTFTGGVIHFDYYKRPEHVGQQRREEATERWNEIATLLTTKLYQKYIVRVELELTVNKIGSDFTFVSPYELHIPFYGCQPRLKGCTQYTDYTSLLETIVCPLANAKLALLEVRCQDDNY